MKPTKEGQIVKFHKSLDGENPNQLYVVLEIKIGGERDRADIQPLGTALAFPGINTVLLRDLEVVEVETNDLLGNSVTVRKSDYSEVTGKVISATMQKVFLDLTKTIHGIETNVWLTVQDNSGKDHEGTLIVR